MKEIDYIRLIDITKEYLVGKIEYDYLKAYWDRIHKEKEREVGEYNIGTFFVPKAPIVFWADKKTYHCVTDDFFVGMKLKS